MSAFVCTIEELDAVRQKHVTINNVTHSLRIILSNPNVYFYGNLYNEPNLRIHLVDSKDSTPETKALFALIEILSFGRSCDLQRLQKDSKLCMQLGIDHTTIVNETAVVRKLQFLTLMSLFSKAVHGNKRRVRYDDIAVYIGGEALEVDGVSPNIRYVEDLVLDIMAAELATCRINHMDKYIEVVNFQVRDIPPVDSQLKFVELEYSGKEQIAVMLKKLDQWLGNCVNTCNNAVGAVDIAVKNRQDYISQRQAIASIIRNKNIDEGINEEKELVNEVQRKIQYYRSNRGRYF